MKIGILTYHRSHNFGALFQAIATRVLLSSKGHDVTYINYWPDYHHAMYAIFSWKAFNRGGFRYKLGYLKLLLRSLNYKLPLYFHYKSFIKKEIEPYCRPMGTEYDIIIYGSDQIWRKQPWMNTFNPVYFGVHKSKAIVHASYAASMGIINNSAEDNIMLKRLLSHLNYISVREESLLNMIHELGFKDVILSLDPALLLDSCQWNQVFPQKRNPTRISNSYVLYVNYISNSFDEDSIRVFAEKKGLKFIKINGSIMGKDSPDAIVNTSPLELFDYIRNASFVFTSSFHALVFAILYNREFYASFSNNALRAQSLLESLGISERLLPALSNIPNDYKPIDYKIVNRTLADLRSHSIRYLDMVIANCESKINNKQIWQKKKN